jgi:type I restriction enzyme S subunit
MAIQSLNKLSWAITQFNRLFAEPVKNGIYKPKEFHGRGVKLINMGELFAYGFISGQQMKRLELSKREMENYLVKHGDLLFARRSLVLEGSGKCSLVVKPPEPTTFESSIIRVRLNGTVALPLFYYYFFKAPQGRATMASIATRTAVSGITGGNLALLQVPHPPLPSQHKIASILSTYDVLIENNTRRIKILEEMAQAIYREWFVNFHFPGHEKVKMVNSPLGRIPEGWGVGTLDGVLTTLESGSRPKGGIDPETKGVPSIGAENIIGLGRYDYSKEKFVTREFFNNMKRGHIKSGDVLLYKDGAQIGRKSMFRDGFPHDECCINEHVFILRTNVQCSQNYLFFWLEQPEMTQNIINLNANAAQPGINQSGVRGLPILLPPSSLLEKVEQTLEPLLGALFNCAKRNNILCQTRDLLLPKLISGELDVSDLDIKIEGKER